MEHINIHDAKTRLSAILAEVEKGKKVIICRSGKPVAELVPYHPRSRTAPHPVLSRIRISYDPVEDLSAEEWGTIE